jgi:hypothetical protein
MIFFIADQGSTIQIKSPITKFVTGQPSVAQHASYLGLMDCFDTMTDDEKCPSQDVPTKTAGEG